MSSDRHEELLKLVEGMAQRLKELGSRIESLTPAESLELVRLLSKSAEMKAELETAAGSLKQDPETPESAPGSEKVDQGAERAQTLQSLGEQAAERARMLASSLTSANDLSVAWFLSRWADQQGFRLDACPHPDLIRAAYLSRVCLECGSADIPAGRELEQQMIAAATQDWYHQGDQQIGLVAISAPLLAFVGWDPAAQWLSYCADYQSSQAPALAELVKSIVEAWQAETWSCHSRSHRQHRDERQEPGDSERINFGGVQEVRTCQGPANFPQFWPTKSRRRTGNSGSPQHGASFVLGRRSRLTGGGHCSSEAVAITLEVQDVCVVQEAVQDGGGNGGVGEDGAPLLERPVARDYE